MPRWPGQLPGDFNHDGAVDTADYIIWRKGLGTTYTQADYNDWQTNFGATLGSGAPSAFPFPPSPLTPAVPEPSAVALALLASAVLRSSRIRRGGRRL
jgi:hypothetical protein